jgi:hypothetical protein
MTGVRRGLRILGSAGALSRCWMCAGVMACQGVVGSGVSLGQAVAAVPVTPVICSQIAKRRIISAR